MIIVWYALGFLFSSVGFALVVLIPLVIWAVLQARKRGGWRLLTLAGVMVVVWVAAVVLMVTWEFIY